MLLRINKSRTGSDEAVAYAGLLARETSDWMLRSNFRRSWKVRSTGLNSRRLARLPARVRGQTSSDRAQRVESRRRALDSSPSVWRLQGAGPATHVGI